MQFHLSAAAAGDSAGYLQVDVVSSQNNFPIPDASVTISPESAPDIPLEQLRMQPGETVEARWAKLEEIEQLGKQGAFVPIALSQLAPVRERFEQLISSRGRCEGALLQID